jgi:hypothetical protein
VVASCAGVDATRNAEPQQDRLCRQRHVRSVRSAVVGASPRSIGRWPLRLWHNTISRRLVSAAGVLQPRAPGGGERPGVRRG